MQLLKFSLITLILLIPEISPAARSSAKITVKSLSTASQLDTTPPTITITSPGIKRGLKLVSKTSGITVTGRAKDDGGIAWVTVNGTTARLDGQGNFSADIHLKPGDNRVAVTAQDASGNRGTETFSINQQGDPAATAQKSDTLIAGTGKSYALVMGINAYKQIAKLKTAVNDARTIAQLLESNYGFITTVLLDGQATRAAILRELNTIKNRLNPDDRLLIYYAGHGWDDRVTETSYWLPVDAEQNDPTNWVEARTITDQLKRSQARQVLVVADSCYSGTISRSSEHSLAGLGTRESYLKKMMEKPARILIASGGNEPVSDSGGSGHSIFADVFIKALKNPFDNRFTAEELMTRQIKESVAGRSNQTPEYKIIRNSGHDGGDFVFEKKR